MPGDDNVRMQYYHIKDILHHCELLPIRPGILWFHILVAAAGVNNMPADAVITGYSVGDLPWVNPVILVIWNHVFELAINMNDV